MKEISFMTGVKSTKALIKGVWVPYDMCSSDPSNNITNPYVTIEKDKWEFIGSNNGEIKINDKINNFKQRHCFYVKGKDWGK